MIENTNKKRIGRPKGIPSHLKGTKFSQSYKDKISGGTKRGMARPEVKEKMKKAFCRFREEGTFAKENNPAWKGGTVGYYKQQALIRDHFTCRICNLYDPEIMEVDHIKPTCKFPELEKDINNMQSICPNCHTRKHKI